MSYESYDRVWGALGSQKKPKRQQSKSTPFHSHDHCLFHLNNHGRGILTKAPWSDDVTVHVLMPSRIGSSCSSNGNIQITRKWQFIIASLLLLFSLSYADCTPVPQHRHGNASSVRVTAVEKEHPINKSLQAVASSHVFPVQSEVCICQSIKYHVNHELIFTVIIFRIFLRNFSREPGSSRAIALSNFLNILPF